MEPAVNQDLAPGDPTPEEIERQAVAIRGRWSPQERQKRLRWDWRPDAWRPALVALEVDSELSDLDDL